MFNFICTRVARACFDFRRKKVNRPKKTIHLACTAASNLCKNWTNKPIYSLTNSEASSQCPQPLQLGAGDKTRGESAHVCRARQ